MASHRHHPKRSRERGIEVKQWVISAALVLLFFVVTFSVTIFIMLFPIVGFALMFSALFIVAVVCVHSVFYNSGGIDD